MKEPFLKAVPVLEKIENAGFEAYFVGGSVRDYLLHKSIDDVDIATSARPEEIKQIFEKTVDVGIEHGTVLVIYSGVAYEITTFRTEGEYEDFRHPREVQFIRSLEEDLKRRDLTINAIAMTKDGQLIDPFSGREDLERKIIRTVGNPAERFKEDALRMMRAIRFVSQLDFQVEKTTLLSLKEFGPLLEHIAVERKLAEFTKLLGGRNFRKAIYLLVQQNLHLYLPSLSNYPDVLTKAAQVAASYDLEQLEFWSLLLILIEREDTERFLRSWKMPVKTIKKVKEIRRSYEFRERQEWNDYAIYSFGVENCKHAERIYAAIRGISYIESLTSIQSIYHTLPIKNRSELAVGGADLLDWEGKPGGPWMKNALEKIEKAVVTGEVPNHLIKIKEWFYS